MKKIFGIINIKKREENKKLWTLLAQLGYVFAYHIKLDIYQIAFL
jgi:hypothetical protein